MMDIAMTWAGSAGAMAIMVVMALSGWLTRAAADPATMRVRGES